MVSAASVHSSGSAAIIQNRYFCRTIRVCGARRAKEVPTKNAKGRTHVRPLAIIRRAEDYFFFAAFFAVFFAVFFAAFFAVFFFAAIGRLPCKIATLFVSEVEAAGVAVS